MGAKSWCFESFFSGTHIVWRRCIGRLRGTGWRLLAAQGRRSIGRKPLVLESLECRRVLESRLIISEIAADPQANLLDEDGDASDWIEIYNAGHQVEELQGWYLSDDAADLRKWQFPSVSLQPRDYLLVYASGKDRRRPKGRSTRTSGSTGKASSWPWCDRTDVLSSCPSRRCTRLYRQRLLTA